MPSNQHDSMDVDNGNHESSRRSRGPAVNRVILVARLAADPELGYTPRSQRSHATAVGYERGRGARVPPAEGPGQAGGVLRGLLKKRRLLYLKGRLHWFSWQSADGSLRRGCEVRVGNLQLLDQRPEACQLWEGRASDGPLHVALPGSFRRQRSHLPASTTG
jgi:single-stranded DNA-binding protein